MYLFVIGFALSVENAQTCLSESLAEVGTKYEASFASED